MSVIIFIVLLLFIKDYGKTFRSVGRNNNNNNAKEEE